MKEIAIAAFAGLATAVFTTDVNTHVNAYRKYSQSDAIYYIASLQAQEAGVCDYSCSEHIMRWERNFSSKEEALEIAIFAQSPSPY